MIKLFILLTVIICAVISGVSTSTPPEECDKQTNGTCKSCLAISGCSYCKDIKKCFPRPLTPHGAPCKTSDLQVETCFANAEILLIVFGVVGGVILIAVVVIVCCICLKCNRCQRIKEQNRRDLNERQMEERRAAAEIRTAERNEKADQIRMKYGLMKGKDTSVEYNRMS